MAKKVILGTDIARDAFKIKVNDNFTELYDKDVALGTQINSLDALVGLGGTVESGTNSNGRYIKFVDGTQICVGSIRFIYGGVSVMEQIWGFPSAFTSVNYIGGSFLHAGRTTTSNASKWLGVNLQENTLSTAYFKIWSMSDASIFATGETIEGYAIAIGRWK